MIFGLTHNRNLHCGLGFHIDNHNIFSFIKKTFCMVTVCSLCVVAHLRVLYWRHYDRSWELPSLHCTVIFLSSNPVCRHGNLHAFLSCGFIIIIVIQGTYILYLLFHKVIQLHVSFIEFDPM